MNSTPPNFETFFKQFSDALPKGVVDLQKDMEKNMRAAMESAFRRMNLVTREEFDIQLDVLTRTRAKVDALEQQIAALEASLPPTTATRETPPITPVPEEIPPPITPVTGQTPNS